MTDRDTQCRPQYDREDTTPGHQTCETDTQQWKNKKRGKRKKRDAPVVEFVESFLDEILGRTILDKTNNRIESTSGNERSYIEIGIELMDYRLEANNGEKSSREGWREKKMHDETKQRDDMMKIKIK